MTKISVDDKGAIAALDRGVGRSLTWIQSLAAGEYMYTFAVSAPPPCLRGGVGGVRGRRGESK